MTSKESKVETPDSSSSIITQRVNNPANVTSGNVRQSNSSIMSVTVVENAVSSSSTRPVLCVQNGFVRAAETARRAEQDVISSAGDTPNENVLPIRCNDIPAELHKDRFGSGGRGRCILYNNVWYTPNKFEAECGRASSKDWKRSIRFGGRSISGLIQEGVLMPHATSCTCRVCCDDESAYGPVLFYTPCKRKTKSDGPENVKILKEEKVKEEDKEVKEQDKKAKEDKVKEGDEEVKEGDEEVKEEDEEVNEEDEDDEDSSCCDSDKNVPELKDEEASLPVLIDSNELLSVITSIVKRFNDLGGELEQLQSDFKRYKEHGIAVLEDITKKLMTTSKAIDPPKICPGDKAKCTNCNYDCEMHCSLCPHVAYCSEFCQRKDWLRHQQNCPGGVKAPKNVTKAQ